MTPLPKFQNCPLVFGWRKISPTKNRSRVRAGKQRLVRSLRERSGTQEKLTPPWQAGRRIIILAAKPLCTRLPACSRTRGALLLTLIFHSSPGALPRVFTSTAGHE